MHREQESNQSGACSHCHFCLVGEGTAHSRVEADRVHRELRARLHRVWRLAETEGCVCPRPLRLCVLESSSSFSTLSNQCSLPRFFSFLCGCGAAAVQHETSQRRLTRESKAPMLVPRSARCKLVVRSVWRSLRAAKMPSPRTQNSAVAPTHASSSFAVHPITRYPPPSSPTTPSPFALTPFLVHPTSPTPKRMPPCTHSSVKRDDPRSFHLCSSRLCVHRRDSRSATRRAPTLSLVGNAYIRRLTCETGCHSTHALRVWPASDRVSHDLPRARDGHFHRRRSGC